MNTLLTLAIVSTIISGVASLDRCDIHRSLRVGCDNGTASIKEPECDNVGCCWEALEHGSIEPWCFNKLPEQTTSEPLMTTNDLVASSSTPSATSPSNGISTSSTSSTSSPVQNSSSQDPMTSPGAVVTSAAPLTNTTAPADDICMNAKLVDAPERYYQHPGVLGSYLCDNGTTAGWYAFKMNKTWAEIPAVCLKVDFCNTQLGLRLESSQSLPDEGETIEAQLHTSYMLNGVLECGPLSGNSVKVHNCSDHFAYYIEKSDRCSASICLKEAGEEIPYRYLGKPPPTDAPTTAAVTTQATPMDNTTIVPPDVPYVNPDELTGHERAGIVTVEFQYPESNLREEFEEEFDKPFRPMVAAALNKLLPPPSTAAPTTTTSTTPSPTVVVSRKPAIAPVTKPPMTQSGRVAPDLDHDATGEGPSKRSVNNRWRREASSSPAPITEKYSEDDVFYVSPLPRVKNDVLQASILVKEPDNEGEAVSTARLMEAFHLMNSTDDLQTETGLPLVTYYPGLPRDLRPKVAQARGTVWEMHRDLLIVVIILAILCLLIIIIGLCCIKCKDNGAEKIPSSDPEKGKKKKQKRRPPPTVVENPISDEEMTRDEVPMLEHAHPAYTPNGSGQHLRDDEDGLIVPLDQMTAAELARPELENTRL
eukprot:GHVO01038931.1.p1 GENE.GHVO01038931.1~~GHVO01038931.1.p1  ORF type:complete len:649 (+),score=84.42 GHVO01038931.1:207-2153(+)